MTRPRLTESPICAVESCDRNAASRGYCPKHYQRWRMHGDATYRKNRDWSQITISPAIRNSEYVVVLGASKDIVSKMRHRTKHAARNLLRAALEHGDVVSPPFCARCFEAGDLQAHHWDYDRPLDVLWLCSKCHAAIHVHLRRLTQALTGDAPVSQSLVGAK